MTYPRKLILESNEAE